MIRNAAASIKTPKGENKKNKNILVKTPRTGTQRRELFHIIPNAKRPRAAVGADFMSVRSPERANNNKKRTATR